MLCFHKYHFNIRCDYIVTVYGESSSGEKEKIPYLPVGPYGVGPHGRTDMELDCNAACIVPPET